MLLDENVEARTVAVAEGLARLSSGEAYDRMIEADVPAAPILSHQDVLVDPQITHNGTVVEAELPVYGRYRRVRPAARFSETVPAPSRPAALYAEHSDEILDELGMPAAERRRLRDRGALT